MKNLMYRLIFFSLLIGIAVSCGDDKSSTEPERELSIDQDLVGTWDLTLITTNATGQTIVLTPEQAGVASTATFYADGTFESTSTDSEGTTVDTGTWGVANGVLYLTIDGEEESSSYTVNGNVVTIESTIPIEGFGDIPATLEFTKRM
jgi:hypothetical protein